MRYYVLYDEDKLIGFIKSSISMGEIYRTCKIGIGSKFNITYSDMFWILMKEKDYTMSDNVRELYKRIRREIGND